LKFKDIESQDIPFMIPAICVQEILQGAKDLKEWKTLKEYLSTQDVLFPEMTLDTYTKAAELFFNLRRKGLTIRSTVDCLIAQQVMGIEKGKLLHDDRDFHSIEQHTSLRSL
jgi:predicted nucleic acid-binding protein